MGFLSGSHPAAPYAAMTASDDDEVLLRSLSFQALLGWHLSKLYVQLGDQVRPYRSLSFLAAFAKNPQFDFDAILRLILLGFTSREGLGYTRALLFLADEAAGVIRGTMAVGPQTLDEAKANWKAIDQELSATNETESFAVMAQKTVERSAAIKAKTRPDDAISVQLKERFWPLSALPGALERCFNESQMVIVPAGKEDRARDIWEAVSAGDRSREFVCVPLRKHRAVPGVLLLDRRFRDDEGSAATPDQVAMLNAFAQVAVLIIENFELWQKTQVRDYEDMAHQVREPLWAASSSLKPILESSPNPDLEKVGARIQRAYSIAGGIRLLADLATGREVRSVQKVVPFEAVLDSVRHATEMQQHLSPAGRALRFEIDEIAFLNMQGIKVTADISLVEEALSILLDNASRYSDPGSVVTVSATSGEGLARISVKNVSVVARREELPFFKLRKWRGSDAELVAIGSGVGLWLADQILTVHHGKLDLSLDDASGMIQATVGLPLFGLRKDEHADRYPGG